MQTAARLGSSRLVASNPLLNRQQLGPAQSPAAANARSLARHERVGRRTRNHLAKGVRQGPLMVSHRTLLRVTPTHVPPHEVRGRAHAAARFADHGLTTLSLSVCPGRCRSVSFLASYKYD